MLFRKENSKVNVTFLVKRVSRSTVAMCNEGRHSKPIMTLIAGLVSCPGMPADQSPLTAAPSSLLAKIGERDRRR